jgi:F-type H+-transporting ATPase subunit gamma
MAAVQKIGQVTRAMKLVAAAKYRKAVALLNNARPYAQSLAGLAARLAAADSHHPLLRPTPGQTPLLVAIASDRGLCGAFNANVLRQVRTFAQTLPSGATATFAALGRKAEDAFKLAGIRPVWSYTRIMARRFEATAMELADRLIAAFLEGRHDAVWLIHGGYESALVQRVRQTRLLPLSFPAGPPSWPVRAPELIEPDPAAVAEVLLPRHARAQVRWALLEADTAEQAARMVVMEQASRNADDLVAQLRLEWNKARQDGITSELADITIGAEAVR